MLNLQGWLGLAGIHHGGKLELEKIFLWIHLITVSVFQKVGEKEKGRQAWSLEQKADYTSLKYEADNMESAEKANLYISLCSS